ncbi:MAG: ATP-grasp domain-containing protein [Polyangiaceae bacterium]|nr:ATP-grasp domain-containing protein [Polyangiaceae bacterium]
MSAVTMLCLASFFKGNRFLEQCKRQGARVVLLTREAVLNEAWSRDSIDEVFAMPDFNDRPALLRAVSYLARTRHFDRIAPLDDCDVDTVALLREHLRIPGMGETTARYFRDKLAMRARARDRGIRCPDFVHVCNHDDVQSFLNNVAGPWVIKPRSEANSVGIKVLKTADEAWAAIHELGDLQSFYLIEKMIAGPVYHVDGLIFDKKVVFADAHKYHQPILQIISSGGIFATRTLDRNGAEATELRAHLQNLVDQFGLVRGVTHTEMIRSEEDGQFYFLETAARVGGGHIADMVEISTGVKLWEEWANIEIGQGEKPYTPPTPDTSCGAVLFCLAQSEHPDASAYTEPYIARRLLDKKQHVGFILKGSSQAEVEGYMNTLIPRMEKDFLMTLPRPDKRLF